MHCITDAVPRIEQLRQEGVLNVNKPAGITSFTVVKKIRAWTGARKVGHAGTLDPMATGVLIILTGKATKRSAEFMNRRKEYRATIRLCRQSDTDDLEGKITAERPVPDFSEQELDEALQKFSGTVMQVPPMYAALRKDGKRLYKLARQGVVVEREPRPVEIYSIELLSWEKPEMQIRVNCGRGTYIRALARDVGEELKAGGLLSRLARTRVGDCTLEDSWSLDALETALNDQHEDLPET